MAPQSYFKQKTINGKVVYIVESHHFALLPWAKVRRELGVVPNLLTLDHHTDTHTPFLSTACVECYEAGEADNFELLEWKQNELLQSIDWENDESIAAAIDKLKYDEHITTATRAKIIDFAFCINLMDSTTLSVEESALYESALEFGNASTRKPEPKPPFNYHLPEDKVFLISSICAVDCDRMPHTDDCREGHFSQVLESKYLENQLAIAKGFCDSLGLPAIEAAPYILDVDLDYLHTESAISPTDHATLYRLIRGATAITIAIERECFDELLLDGQSITPDAALSMLFEHIDRATA